MKTHSLIKLLPVFVVCMVFAACKQAVICGDCWIIQPVRDTYFKIFRNGQVFNDSMLSCTKLYYKDGGKTISDPGYDDTSFMYVAYSYFGAEEFRNSNIAMFRYLVSISINEGIHDFYLQYPDGDIDTLWVTGERVSNEQGKKERCYCTTPLRELKFNGKDAVEDTSIHLSDGQPVYIFEK
ncbi:MAG: hypothetical protein QM642_09630 [Edaphocola sp.]